MKPGLVMVCPLMPRVMEGLAPLFEVHKLWEAANKEALLAKLAPTTRAIATDGTRGADADLMKKLPKLEIVGCQGVGVDAIDLAYAREHKVVVTNTPDVLNDDVADLAMALLLATIRRIPQGDRYVREGKWLKAHMALTDTLRNRTLGMVGFGRIGKTIARRAAAFDLKIVYHTRTIQTDQPYVHYPRLVEMARDADILMVIVPGGAATRHLINAHVLEALGPTGYLINVARGSVVDEAALIKALQQGKIAGAGLDVFENEPNVPEALIKMDNVVLAPHVGSATHHTRNAMAQLVVDNLKAWSEGRPPLTPVK
ncbi:MAG TPA: 2-hydroxyacid dehydrogenase [Alphaproteobacteria bacterium]|jgi:lactate dehydrogenase-like 2-hydroxyacid dehydrogenase